MKIRRAIATVAILGLVALGAVVTTQSALACGDKTMGASAGGSGGCCSGHMTKVAEGGTCPMMGKGGCTFTAGGPCVNGGQCNMSPSECAQMIRSFYKTHGWLGVEMACANPQEMTPTITKVFPGSPAEAAGLQVGDVLESVNGITYGPDQMEALQKLAANGMKPGDALTYQVKRANQSTDVEVKATLAKVNKKDLAVLISDHQALAHKTDKAEAASAKS